MDSATDPTPDAGCDPALDAGSDPTPDARTPQRASVALPDQTTDGRTVTVSRAALPAGGVVAVVALAEPLPRAVLGHSGPLDAGEHRDVEVELDERLDGTRTLAAVILDASTGRDAPSVPDGLALDIHCWRASDVARVREADGVRAAIADFVR